MYLYMIATLHRVMEITEKFISWATASSMMKSHRARSVFDKVRCRDETVLIKLDVPWRCKEGSVAMDTMAFDKASEEEQPHTNFTSGSLS